MITPSKGTLGKVPMEPLLVCARHTKIIYGTSKGNKIKWQGTQALKATPVCKDGPMYCLFFNPKDKTLYAGGYDGIIIAYGSAKLDEKFRIDLKKLTSTL